VGIGLEDLMAAREARGCRFLLATLVLLLVMFPILTSWARPLLLIAVVASVFAGGVIAVNPGRSRVMRAVVLAAVQIILTVAAVVQRVESSLFLVTVGLALATTAVLICYCIYCVLGYVLQARYISRDQIYAGISVYLMLGFAFGSIYYLMVVFEPASFSVNTPRLEASGNPDLMYFSFVTLATLGYGDITPVATISRALSQVEALAGTLYMAVFMARLVSLAVERPSAGTRGDMPGSKPASEVWAASEGDQH
jgi:hypothetical protein